MALSSEVAARRAALAHRLYTLAGGSQVAVMAALFLLWKQFGVPFRTAAEGCVVAGAAVYTCLGTAAAVALAAAQLRPASLAFAYLSRFASVVIYATLRYVHGQGVVQSLATWAFLYLTSSLLVRRIERRAARRLGL